MGERGKSEKVQAKTSHPLYRTAYIASLGEAGVYPGQRAGSSEGSCAETNKRIHIHTCRRLRVTY